MALFSSGFKVISKKKGLQGKTTLFSPGFEVISKKRSSGQNGLLITVFGLFSISSIIFMYAQSSAHK